MDTTNTAPGDKLIRLDTFDTAVAVDPSAEDDAKRRFMTLILQTTYRDGGNIGHVLRATNTSGEVFAVKLLKDNAILSDQTPDRSAEQAAAHLANTAALFEEYRHLCTVSYLRGFPRVYGYGSCEDDPLILMEWVEGTSLKQALPLLPHDASGGLTTQMVAAVGNAVLRALLMTQGLVNPVVHRDLSPANIMFRTTSRTLEPRCSDDEALVQIIMKGISVEQRDRPTEQQMLEALSAYLTDAESEGREGAGSDTAIDIDSGTHLKVDVAGERAREILEQARHDAMTRRRFIIGGVVAAVAGLGVIGAATHGFGIPDYLDGIRGSLDYYTWDQLQEISLKIKAAETRSEAREIVKRYHLLDDNGHIPYPCTKRVTLTNGLQVGAQLVGIRHDELLDGTGKAGLTFMFDAGIAERNAAAEPPSAGWADCELREWLDSDGLKLLPNELRALIKSVKKVSNNVGAARSASCLSELPATLWLPAMVELCGVQPPESFAEGFHYLADIYNGEGKEYQLFRELKVSPYTTNETLVRQWKGKDTCWWERTASPDTSESEGILYMNRVGRDGDVFTYATPAEKPNKRTCVIPGFCI